MVYHSCLHGLGPPMVAECVGIRAISVSRFSGRTLGANKFLQRFCSLAF